jgi:sugar/nucleoside kinase (ribokinase family)
MGVFMPTFYGIGRSTVDIFIPVNKIPLKFAEQNLTRLSQDEMEKIYPNLEKHKANNIKKVAGGISANIVKIASYLGAKSFFTSTIGNDENGKLFERELAKYGVCAFFR